MGKGHDHHDHDHHGHAHDHDEEVLEFSAKKVSKVKSFDSDALIHVDGSNGGSFAIASSKKEGYKFDKKELGAALDEMDDAGAFSDVELDDAALASLMGMGGEQQQRGGSRS